jgi:hypothetical protein
MQQADFPSFKLQTLPGTLLFNSFIHSANVLGFSVTLHYALQQMQTWKLWSCHQRPTCTLLTHGYQQEPIVGVVRRRVKVRSGDRTEGGSEWRGNSSRFQNKKTGIGVKREKGISSVCAAIRVEGMAWWGHRDQDTSREHSGFYPAVSRASTVETRERQVIRTGEGVGSELTKQRGKRLVHEEMAKVCSICF